MWIVELFIRAYKIPFFRYSENIDTLENFLFILGFYIEVCEAKNIRK